MQGLAFGTGSATIGEVHVTKRDTPSDPTREGVVWEVTFRGNPGDVPDLVPTYAGTLLGADAVATVTEFIQGVANHFVVEPHKANGAPLKDLSAAAGFEGQDVFFTEMWSSPPDVLDGTHTWVSDGGVATYDPVVYEVQSITTDIGAGSISGTFEVALDRSGVNLWGGRNVSASIDASADEVAMKTALEDMPNVGEVYVNLEILDSGLNTRRWTITFTSQMGDVPLLELDGSAFAMGGTVAFQEVQKGITEVQIVRTSGRLGTVHEKQTITSHAGTGRTLDGQFSVKFGEVDPVLVDADVSAADLEAVLEAFPTIGDVGVTRVANPNTLIFNAYIWTVEFKDPVGDLDLIEVGGIGTDLIALGDPMGAQSAAVDVVQVTQGFTAIDGTFLLSYDGVYTDNLDFQASRDDVKRELEELSTIGEVDVHRTDKSNGHEWRITYKSNLGDLDLIGVHPQAHEMQVVRTFVATRRRWAAPSRCPLAARRPRPSPTTRVSPPWAQRSWH